MKSFKKYSFIFACIVGSLHMTLNAYASDYSTIHKSINYITNSEEHKNPGFEPRITKYDREYELTDIQYNVISEEEITPEISYYETNSSQYTTKRERSQCKPKPIIRRNGEKYYLVELKEVKTTPVQVKETFTDTKTYEKWPIGKTIPKTCKTSITTSHGEHKDVSLRLKNVTEGETHWDDNVLIASVVLKNYRSPKYVINNQVVYVNDLDPFKDEYSKLGKLLNINNKIYNIQKVEWDGDPYVNKNHIICRRLKITGQKMHKTYTADYESTITVNGDQRYMYKAKYQNVVPNTTIDPQKKYEITAIGTYEWVEDTENNIETNIETNEDTHNYQEKDKGESLLFKILSFFSK